MRKRPNRRLIVKSAAAFVAGRFVCRATGALANTSSGDSMTLPKLKTCRPLDGRNITITEHNNRVSYIFSGRDYSEVIGADINQCVLIAPEMDQTGASGAWVKDIPDKRIKPEWFLADGENVAIDSGPAIRRALLVNSKLENHTIYLSQCYFVDCDPASALKVGRFGHSIHVPSNTTIQCDINAKIIQADNAPSWCRTVSFSGSSDIKVRGHLRVDGNVDNINPRLNNEHMHGLFIFNCNRIEIERLTVENCRGDNLFIGGSHENSPSSDITILWFKGVRAGRKNLVWQFYNNVLMKSVFLDNRNGGNDAGGPLDSTNKHSFDVEPDLFTGRVRHYGRIDILTTYGTGNDFTAGKTAQKAESLIVDIGYFEMNVQGNSDRVPAWTQYASKVNIGTWKVRGLSNANAPILLLYAARLNVVDAEISGSTRSVWSFLIEISAKGLDYPIANFGVLKVDNKIGGGLECRNSQLSIGEYYANTARLAGWSRSTSKVPEIRPRVWINDLRLDERTRSMSSDNAWLISKLPDANAIDNRFVNVQFRSLVADKLICVFQSGGNTRENLFIGKIENRTRVINSC